MPDIKDSQSRKWQMTLNNPIDKGFTHEQIREQLATLKSLVYYCMADEIGENQTPHTHLYIALSSAVRFSTLKNLFGEAHMEMARGTSQQNRDYIAKEGKWEQDEKHVTSIPGTFEEWGEMPQERQGARVDFAELNALILAGADNVDIVQENPKYMQHLMTIDRMRQEYKAKKYRREFRALTVTYIYGKTGTGKTRSVMEGHGYENVYRVSEYDHPFDAYQGEDVILFDEFQSQFRMSEMLNYLDGYPLALPCRYNNRQACYTQVYLISNWRPEEQYHKVRAERYEAWRAFLRRVHTVIHMAEGGAEAYGMAAYMDKFINPAKEVFGDGEDEEEERVLPF